MMKAEPITHRSAFLRCLLVLTIAVATQWAQPVAFAESPGQGQQAAQEDPRQMRFGPVEFKPPEPDRVVLENGMVVYLLEDHELPLVTMTARMRTGDWLDSPERIGVAGITGAVMRTGGTARMTPEQIDEELEQIAAGLSVGIGTVAGSAMLDVLKKDFELGLRIFADVLRTPRFDPKRLDLAKLQTIEAIRRRHDRPQSIAGREFPKLLYGPAHPFARESSISSISRITRDDLVAFHRQTVHPNGIILGVTGDFAKEDMLAQLRKVFGDWPKGDVPSIDLPPIGADGMSPGTGTGNVVRFVNKEASQAHLRIGHLSLKEDDPDYPALVIVNDILGGSSFRSRLFQDIRTRQGLAYSVGSGVRPGTWERGFWLMYAQKRPLRLPS